MEESVEKFIKYLEDERRMIQESKPTVKLVFINKNSTDVNFANYTIKKTNREIEIDYILPRITMSDEEYVNRMEIYHHFKDLSKYIEYSNLTYQEKFDIVMHILERNIKCIAKTTQTTAINDTELRQFKFPDISSKEIDSLISSGEMKRIINGEDEELTEYEIKIRDAVLNNIEKFSTDIEDTIKLHNEIKEHYFDKKDSFDITDIDIIVDSLKELTFSDKICNLARQILYFLLQNRIKFNSLTSSLENSIEYTPKKKESQEMPSIVPAERELQISYKERKNIYNKIREYYNVPKREVIKDVDFDEMIEIVSLMLKINIDFKSIRTYIRLVLKRLEEKTVDPTTKYLTFKDKLASYLSEEQMAYLDELYIAFEADNDLWMTEFMTYLDEVMKIVSEFDDYSYEVEQAKQLMKVENGN